MSSIPEDEVCQSAVGLAELSSTCIVENGCLFGQDFYDL